MARSQQGIRAGKAFVELYANDTALVRGLRSAQRKLKQFSAQITSIGAISLGAGVSIMGAFVPAVNAASRKQETLNKFAAVFGQHVEQAAKFADDLAASVGRSSTEIKDSMSAFQGFFTGMGASSSEALGLSKTMQQLALDFASFNNISDDEAMQRFISAMSGSSEVLDRFGINIKASALEPELQRMFGTGVSGATEMQKAMARLEIIQRAMGSQGAIGDAEKTSSSFANQMKRLNAVFNETLVAVGDGVLPVVTKLLVSVNAVIPQITNWIKVNKELFNVSLMAGAALAIVGVSLVSLGVASTLASIAIGGIATVLAVLSSPIGIAIAGLTAFAAWSVKSGKAIEFLQSKFPKLTETVKDAFAVVKNAMAGGDIVSAARVMWAAINLEWTRGINSISKKWTQFSTMAMQAAMLISAEQAQQERASAAEEAEQRLKQAQQSYEDAKRRATQANKEKPSEVKAAINGGGLSANATSNLVSQGGTFSSLSSREFVSMSSMRQKNPSERIVESVDKLTREVIGVRRLIDDFGVQP